MQSVLEGEYSHCFSGQFITSQVTKPPTKEEGPVVPHRGPDAVENRRQEESSVQEVPPHIQPSNDHEPVVNGFQRDDTKEALEESSDQKEDSEDDEDVDEVDQEDSENDEDVDEVDQKELEDAKEETLGPCTDPLKGVEQGPDKGTNSTGPVEERATASKICTGSFSRGMERFRSQSPSPHVSKSET